MKTTKRTLVKALSLLAGVFTLLGAGTLPVSAAFLPTSPAAASQSHALTPFFQRAAAADDKETVKTLLGEIMAQPDIRRFEFEPLETPVIIPFEKLTPQQSKEADTWISAGKVFCHISDDSLAEYNDFYYPCMQHLFRKISSAEKVVRVNLPIWWENEYDKPVSTNQIALHEVIEPIFNEFTKENNIDFAVVIVKTTAPIDWKNLSSLKKIPVEISLFAVPRAYKGIMEKSMGDPKRITPPMSLTVKGGAKELLGYFASPAVDHWIQLLPHAVYINPLIFKKSSVAYVPDMVIIHGIAYTFAEIINTPALSILVDVPNIGDTQLTVQHANWGEDYVSHLTEEVLDKMVAEGVLPEQDAAYLRTQPIAHMIVKDTMPEYYFQPSDGISLFLLDRWNIRSAKLNNRERMLATIACIATEMINNHRREQRQAAGDDTVLYIDTFTDASYMAYTVLHLFNFPRTPEELMKKHDKLEKSIFYTWNEERQIAVLKPADFQTRPAAKAKTESGATLIDRGVSRPGKPEPKQQGGGDEDMERLLKWL